MNNQGFSNLKKNEKKPKSKKSHKFTQELHNTKKISLMHLPSTTPLLLLLHNTKKFSLMHLPSTTPLLLLLHNTKKFSLMHLPSTTPLLLLHVSHCQFQ